MIDYLVFIVNMTPAIYSQEHRATVSVFTRLTILLM